MEPVGHPIFSSSFRPESSWRFMGRRLENSRVAAMADALRLRRAVLRGDFLGVTDARHLSQARLPPGVLPAPEAGGQEQEQTHGGRGDFDDLKASSPGKLFVFGLTRNRRHGGHGESLRGHMSRSKPRFSVRWGANSSKQKFAL